MLQLISGMHSENTSLVDLRARTSQRVLRQTYTVQHPTHLDSMDHYHPIYSYWYSSVQNMTADFHDNGRESELMVKTLWIN